MRCVRTHMTRSQNEQDVRKGMRCVRTYVTRSQNEQDVRSVIKDIYHSISLSSDVITWLSEVGI